MNFLIDAGGVREFRDWLILAPARELRIDAFIDDTRHPIINHAVVRSVQTYEEIFMSSLPADYPTDALAAFELLKSRKSLSVDDMKVLAMIENFGECFYQAIARGVPNAEAKALLQRSGQEERGHAARLIKAIKLKGGSFELPKDEDNVFIQSAPKEIMADGDFMSGLAQGEMDGDLQYQAWADAEPNAEVAKLLRQNGREETRHGERIAEVKKLLAL